MLILLAVSQVLAPPHLMRMEGSMDETISQLLADLADENPHVRDPAIDQLVELGLREDRVVPHLISQLTSKNRNCRFWTVSILGRIGPRAETAVPALTRLLEDKDQTDAVRSMAANTLGLVGARGVPALAKQLANADDPFLRRQAASALGRTSLSGDTGIAALIDALADPDVDVRIIAVGSLTQFGKHAIQHLREAVLRRDARTQMYAAEALLRITPEGLRDAAPALIQGLKSDQMEVRTAAAHAWGEILPRNVVPLDALEKKQAIDALIRSLKDPSPKVRYTVAEALAAFGPDAKGAASLLIALLADKDQYVRGYSAMALGNIGSNSKAAVPALMKAVDYMEGDEDPGVSNFAVQALGKIGSDVERVVPFLERALKENKWKDDEDFQFNVHQALAILRKKAEGK